MARRAGLKDAQAARRLLAKADYVANTDLAMAVFLACELRRPLLLEGEAGVGKTAVAQALAAALGTKLIRMQCYEGLDAQAALYEWNYQKQLLAIRLSEAGGKQAAMASVFTEEYLFERPLLQAIRQERPPVLLIDEIDRADEEFEAFLLEILADFQVTVPELGTLAAKSIPHCVLTSNATRQLSDALRRRCLYHYLDYPDPDVEQAIVERRNPHADAELVAQAVTFVGLLRKEDLEKKPGIAETLDWIAALTRVGLAKLDDRGKLDHLQASLACLLKTAGDRQAIPVAKTQLLAEMAASA